MKALTVKNNPLDIVNRCQTIQELEIEMKKLGQVDFPVKHTFAEGVYVRTMTGIKGTFAIGKRHRSQIVNIILSGKALIYSGDGPAKEITAPCTFISEPYVKKMAFFLEDTEWINIHPTNETDLDIIEKEVIITDEEFIQRIEAQEKIKGGL